MTKLAKVGTAVVFVAIRRLMAQVDPPRRRIGF